ncbi:MAG: HIT domain-containing protein [bacterium]
MKQNNCIFCSIAHKEINADIVVESENYIAFKDINAQAPIHVLLIPKKHYENLHSIDDLEICKDLMTGIKEVVTKLNIKDGYRVVANTGEIGGQTVNHMHFHILSGRSLHWPPG